MAVRDCAMKVLEAALGMLFPQAQNFIPHRPTYLLTFNATLATNKNSRLFPVSQTITAGTPTASMTTRWTAELFLLHRPRHQHVTLVPDGLYLSTFFWFRRTGLKTGLMHRVARLPTTMTACLHNCGHKSEVCTPPSWLPEGHWYVMLYSVINKKWKYLW